MPSFWSIFCKLNKKKWINSLQKERKRISTFSFLHLGQLLFPPKDEQREIITILNAIDHKIDLHRKKSAVLDDLFKALLHKLMKGEIHVSDLDLSALQVAHDSSLKLNGNNGK